MVKTRDNCALSARPSVICRPVDMTSHRSIGPLSDQIKIGVPKLHTMRCMLNETLYDEADEVD